MGRGRTMRYYMEYAKMVDNIIHSDLPKYMKLERIEGYTYELQQILSNNTLAETLIEEEG